MKTLTEGWAAWPGKRDPRILPQLGYLASTLEFRSLNLTGTQRARPVRPEPWPLAKLRVLETMQEFGSFG